jgi:hypothetical protein
MNAVLKPSLYEQLLALPEHVDGEILHGALYTQPRPMGRHGLAAGALNADWACDILSPATAKKKTAW